MSFLVKPGDKLIDHVVYSGYGEDEALEIAAGYEHLMVTHALADVHAIARMVFVTAVTIYYQDSVHDGLRWIVKIDATVY